MFTHTSTAAQWQWNAANDHDRWPPSYLLSLSMMVTVAIGSVTISWVESVALNMTVKTSSPSNSRSFTMDTGTVVVVWPGSKDTGLAAPVAICSKSSPAGLLGKRRKDILSYSSGLAPLKSMVSYSGPISHCSYCTVHVYTFFSRKRASSWTDETQKMLHMSTALVPILATDSWSFLYSVNNLFILQ